MPVISVSLSVDTLLKLATHCNLLSASRSAYVEQALTRQFRADAPAVRDKMSNGCQHNWEHLHEDNAQEWDRPAKISESDLTRIVAENTNAFCTKCGAVKDEVTGTIWSDML